MYAGAKLTDKISMHQRNPNRNTKPGWEVWLKGQINKQWEQGGSSKEGKIRGNNGIKWVKKDNNK